MKRSYIRRPEGFAKAVANCTAAYRLVETTFETPMRPAALSYCKEVDKYVQAATPGHVVEYVDEPGVFGVVLQAFEGHEFRGDYSGVQDWGSVRPARLPGTFVCRAQQRRCRVATLHYNNLDMYRPKVRPWVRKMVRLGEKEFVYDVV